jgi:hypothetical protein
MRIRFRQNRRKHLTATTASRSSRKPRSVPPQAPVRFWSLQLPRAFTNDRR